MADLAHPRLVAVIVAAFIAVAATWVAVLVFRWRRITWRDQMDAKLGAMPKEARDNGHWAVWKVLTRHEEVAQPSLVLLRIRNAGFGGIKSADVRRPLTFTFPGRVVKEFTVTDCHGVSRQEIQPPGDLNPPQAVEGTICLPPFPMKRRAGFKLLVLLSGAGGDVVADGRLRRGRVLRESRGPGALVQSVAFGSVLLVLFGVQAGITFSQAATLPSYCASGRLNITGSTAFAPTAQEIASAYTHVCHDAAISVSPIATFNGLNQVADGPSSASDPPTQEIAMSDGQAPPGYQSLTGTPLAVILFAVVVNKEDRVYNLTTAQLRAIWLGKVTNWDRVGGPDLPIKIVARTTASGTRRAFDRYVLRQAEPPFTSYNCLTANAVPNASYIRCEVNNTDTLLQRVNSIPGAIGYAQVSDAATYPDVSTIKINGEDATIGDVEMDRYSYWTVEWLYTDGRPAPGSLAAKFIGYTKSVTANDILRSEDYTPCVDLGLGQSLLKTQCRP